MAARTGGSDGRLIGKKQPKAALGTRQTRRDWCGGMGGIKGTVWTEVKYALHRSWENAGLIYWIARGERGRMF